MIVNANKETVILRNICAQCVIRIRAS